jgi:two-component system sensor histidine kinase KdpD
MGIGDGAAVQCPRHMAEDPIRHRWDWRGFTSAVAVVVAATAIGWPLYHGFNLPDSARRPLLANINILMLYLLGVLWVSTRFSSAAAIAASLLGVAAFDLCFVPPYLALTVADEQYLVTFVVMLLTAITISTLTHRVRARAEEARAAWQRVEAESLRNTLLAGVSHDLRTPLAAITGTASTLMQAGDQLAQSARLEMLDTICTEAERMERLISNLLDMTRLEHGGPSVKKEWVPLQEVVGSALHHLVRSLRGRTVKTDLPNGLPLVHMDALAIEQVMVNLIHNAVEYTPPASPIEVSARANAGETVIEVADRGPGLPSGSEQRVFEKFFRYRPAQSHRGIGLGLSICRAIIQSHGGSITAANRPGGGAIFRFTLPLTEEAPVVNGSD